MPTTPHSPADRLRDPGLAQRSVNTIRTLALDAIEQAGSGHPGAPLGMADLAYVLWSREMRFDPARPDWPDRDRFVLSAGHASMLLYAMLHLTGYDLPLEEIRRFRQWGSRTPGHPEAHHPPGVEMTSGPLGQGIAHAVGMAVAERHLAARLHKPGFNPVDHRTYVIASDGDMMEGVQAEACSLAGHLRLGKLTVLYDDNGITIDGSTALAFDTEDVGARFEAYGWHVERIDGHDRAAIAAALDAARAQPERPSLVVARTHIALGSPHKQDTSAAHGSPLGAEEVARTKKAYGFPPDGTFRIEDDVREHFLALGRRGREARERWEEEFARWRAAYPGPAELWDALHDPQVPAGAPDRPRYATGEKVATRKASGAALSWLKPLVPALVGGSADLTPSNVTRGEDDKDFAPTTPAGRYLRFGIREHGMAAILNGMALHGGILPYGATFLVFSDYLRPSLRLAALMGNPVIHVFTHDSIFVGEDGPTHQPIEQLAALRAIPGLTVIRPSDAEETVAAWELAVARRGPVVLCLTRQGLPVLARGGLSARDGLARGAYVLADGGDAPEAIAFATGSEVHVTLEAAASLTAEGRAVRVVAVPSWELFFEQDEAYRREVLAPAVTHRLAVEAASPFGWERFTGMEGEIVGLRRFGASAPASDLQREFGFTVDAVESKLRRLLARD